MAAFVQLFCADVAEFVGGGTVVCVYVYFEFKVCTCKLRWDNT